MPLPLDLSESYRQVKHAQNINISILGQYDLATVNTQPLYCHFTLYTYKIKSKIAVSKAAINKKKIIFTSKSSWT
jgi:hypothetical protein